MPNHFVAINRGVDGFRYSDFTTGTSTSAASDIELRIADVDGQGNTMTRKDVIKALKAFEVWLLNTQETTFPPL